MTTKPTLSDKQIAEQIAIVNKANKMLEDAGVKPRLHGFQRYGTGSGYANDNYLPASRTPDSPKFKGMIDIPAERMKKAIAYATEAQTIHFNKTRDDDPLNGLICVGFQVSIWQYEVPDAITGVVKIQNRIELQVRQSRMDSDLQRPHDDKEQLRRREARKLRQATQMIAQTYPSQPQPITEDAVYQQ